MQLGALKQLVCDEVAVDAVDGVAMHCEHGGHVLTIVVIAIERPDALRDARRHSIRRSAHELSLIHI